MKIVLITSLRQTQDFDLNPNCNPRYWVEWESPTHTVLVLIAFVVACQFFEPYMAPIALLLVFLKYYVACSWGASKTSDDDDEQQTDEDDQQMDQQDDQDDDKSKVMTYKGFVI